MHIKRDDLSGSGIAALLEEHLRSMQPHSPPESRHALDLEGLRDPDIHFYSAWEDDELIGCGAFKQLDATHAEIKSMRTATKHLRKGVARQLLQHLIDEARCQNIRRLSLETGSMEAFLPARRLYEAFGFEVCQPFADYLEDSYSVFMTRPL